MNRLAKTAVGEDCLLVSGRDVAENDLPPNMVTYDTRGRLAVHFVGPAWQVMWYCTDTVITLPAWRNHRAGLQCFHSHSYCQSMKEDAILVDKGELYITIYIMDICCNLEVLGTPALEMPVFVEPSPYSSGIVERGKRNGFRFMELQSLTDCVCSIDVLMTSGCCCGQMLKERDVAQDSCREHE